MLRFTAGKECGLLFPSELARLEALVVDMKRIRQGIGPALIAGDGAPLLDDWTVGARFVPCLVGAVTGHPKLPGTNRTITSSDLWLLSEDEIWARTLSRWYRLGRPADLANLHG